MPQMYYITPVDEDGEPVDPGYGVGKPPTKPGHKPGHPLPIPPLPGVWPPKVPGEPMLPIYTPPGLWPPVDKPGGPEVMPPINIPDSPEKPLPPPGTIWPPLPPDAGISGKVAVLVWVLGVGARWAVIDTNLKPTPK